MLKLRFPCEDSNQQSSFPSLDEIQMIENHIMDDISKQVFGNRLLASLTENVNYIRDMICCSTPMSILKKLVDGNTYIYGAGRRGQLIIDLFPEEKWKGFIDNYKTGYIDTYPIKKLSEIRFDEDDYVVVSIKEQFEEVEKLLAEQGVNKENIVILEKYIQEVNDNIYLDRRCLEGRKHCDGIFFDIGCFDGTDTIRALEYFDDPRLNVIALEPNEYNNDMCLKRLTRYNSVKLIKKGVSNREGTILFVEDGGASRVTDEGDKTISITTIDKLAGEEKVGFIKMDIEGLECEALEGAKDVIVRDSPILAVSVYHKKNDIWKIPLEILRINPEYRFYMGHYKTGWDDTVLYAVIPLDEKK